MPFLPRSWPSLGGTEEEPARRRDQESPVGPERSPFRSARSSPGCRASSSVPGGRPALRDAPRLQSAGLTQETRLEGRSRRSVSENGVLPPCCGRGLVCAFEVPRQFQQCPRREPEPPSLLRRGMPANRANLPRSCHSPARKVSSPAPHPSANLRASSAVALRCRSSGSHSETGDPGLECA